MKRHIPYISFEKGESEKKEKEKAEWESKKCIEISTADGNYWVGLSWSEIKVPFELDDIHDIGYAGGGKLARNSSKKTYLGDRTFRAERYYCDNSLDWHKINGLPEANKCFQVNGYTVFSSNGMLWFSRDCQNWKKASLPTREPIQDMIYYQDKYVFYTSYPRTYSYIRKKDLKKKAYISRW